jgi:hypothetical protein
VKRGMYGTVSHCASLLVFVVCGTEELFVSYRGAVILDQCLRCWQVVGASRSMLAGEAS